MKNILQNREWRIEGAWHQPMKHLQQFKSVSFAELFNTISSAGDWSGLFVQKINKRTYVIPFFQRNNYPGDGFTLTTGPAFLSHGTITKSELAELFNDITQ